MLDIDSDNARYNAFLQDNVLADDETGEIGEWDRGTSPGGASERRGEGGGRYNYPHPFPLGESTEASTLGADGLDKAKAGDGADKEEKRSGRMSAEVEASVAVLSSAVKPVGHTLIAAHHTL